MDTGNSLVRWFTMQYQRIGGLQHWKLRGVLAVVLITCIVLANYGISAAGAQSNDDDVTVCVNKWNGAMRVLLQGECSRSEYPMTVNPEGQPGPAGQDGLTGYTMIVGSHDVADGGTWSLDCPTGMVAIDGGAKYPDSEKPPYVFASLNTSPKFSQAVDYPETPTAISTLPTGWDFAYVYSQQYDSTWDQMSAFFQDFNPPNRAPVVNSWVSCMNTPGSQP